MSTTGTSRAQLTQLLSIFRRTVKRVHLHIGRFALAYGFLTGAVTMLSFLAAFVWYGLLAYPLPWKTIDANSSHFSAEDFRFTDYTSRSQLEQTLRQIFPSQTTKQQIDEFMTQKGARIRKYQAAKREQNPPNLYYYEYTNLRSTLTEVMGLLPAGENAWKIAIYYDENDRLVKIVAIGP